MKKITIFMMVLLLLLAASAQAGIVALYHLDNNADDDSGNNNDGAVVGASFVAGIFDEAIDLSGSGDYVGVGDDSTLRFGDGDSITIEAWIQPSGSGLGVIVQKGGTTDTNANYAFRQNGLKLDFFYRGTDNAWHGVQTDDDVLEAGEWAHVAVTYTFGSPGATTIWVNSSSEAFSWNWGDGSSDPQENAQALILGGVNFWAQEYDGLLDETRIWNEALGQGDIDDSYSLADVVVTKTLVGSVPAITGDTNFNGIDEVPMDTLITFTMSVTVDNGSAVGLTSVEVKDQLPAELEIVNLIHIVGDATSRTKGNSAKVVITWDDFLAGDFDAGDDQLLTIVAQTDENPGRKGGKDKDKEHQEYTSPGIYELNGGASMSFCVSIAEEEICLVVNSNALDEIEAMGTDED